MTAPLGPSHFAFGDKKGMLLRTCPSPHPSLKLKLHVPLRSEQQEERYGAILPSREAEGKSPPTHERSLQRRAGGWARAGWGGGGRGEGEGGPGEGGPERLALPPHPTAPPCLHHVEESRAGGARPREAGGWVWVSPLPRPGHGPSQLPPPRCAQVRGRGGAAEPQTGLGGGGGPELPFIQAGDPLG